MQWQQMDFPILYDPLNLLELAAKCVEVVEPDRCQLCSNLRVLFDIVFRTHIREPRHLGAKQGL